MSQTQETESVSTKSPRLLNPLVAINVGMAVFFLAVAALLASG